jgi:hypothetical protein
VLHFRRTLTNSKTLLQRAAYWIKPIGIIFIICFVVTCYRLTHYVFQFPLFLSSLVYVLAFFLYMCHKTLICYIAIFNGFWDKVYPRIQIIGKRGKFADALIVCLVNNYFSSMWKLYSYYNVSVFIWDLKLIQFFSCH